MNALCFICSSLPEHCPAKQVHTAGLTLPLQSDTLHLYYTFTKVFFPSIVQIKLDNLRIKWSLDFHLNIGILFTLLYLAK